MSNTDALDAASPTAIPPGTMPGRYEPQGSAWPQVRTVARLSEHLGQSAIRIALSQSGHDSLLHQASASCTLHLHLFPCEISRPCGRDMCMVQWACAHSFTLWLSRLSTMAAPHSMLWLRIRHRPASQLGLLTSALAVPSIILGSILETNALPDFSSSPSVPTGEHAEPSSVMSGEHELPVCEGCSIACHP